MMIAGPVDHVPGESFEQWLDAYKLAQRAVVLPSDGCPPGEVADYSPPGNDLSQGGGGLSYTRVYTRANGTAVRGYWHR